MPRLGIELVGHVREPGLDEARVHARDLHPVAADGVGLAAYEEDGHVLTHPAQGGGGAYYPEAEHHVAHEAACRDKGAEWVGGVFVDDGLVSREPVILRAKRLDTLVVGPEGEVVYGLAAVHGAVFEHVGVAGEAASGDDGRGRLAGAAEYDAVDAALRVPYQPGAHDKAAHGVPEDEVRELGIFLVRPAAELLDVVHDVIPAVGVGKIAEAVLGEDALAVPEVVAADDGEAFGGELTRKGLVPAYVFIDAVRELHDAVQVAVRLPHADVYGRFALAGGEKIFAFGDVRHLHFAPFVV